jgi:hypothetical protein
VLISGLLKEDKWQDKATGMARQRFKVRPTPHLAHACDSSM